MSHPSLPIAISGLSFCCGIILQEKIAQPPSFALATLLFSLMLVGHIKRWRFIFLGATIGAFVLLGMMRFVPVTNEQASNNKHIEAIVHKPLNTNSFGHQYILKNQDDNELLLLQTPLNHQLIIGDRLLVQAVLTPIAKPKNPTDFDFKTYMKRKGVARKINPSTDGYIKLPPKHNFRRWAQLIQKKLIQQLQLLPLKHESKALIMALVLGEKSELSEERIEQYQRAGAMHLLAISGLHVGILLMMFRSLVSPLKRFRFGSTLSTILPIVLLWCFAFITGASASVTRAVTMFSFLQIGLSLKRNDVRIQSLWSSFFVLLFIQPRLIFDVGFQLSYAAVLGIVWILPHWQKLFVAQNKFIQKITSLFGLGLIAQLAVLPLSLYYFHQFPLLFWLSNLLLVPLIGFVIGAGIGCLVISYFPSLYVLLPAADWLLYYYLELVAWVAQWEQFFVEQIPFRLKDAIGLGLVVLVLFYFAQKPNKTKAILLGIISVLFHLQLKINLTKPPKALVAHIYQNSMLVSTEQHILHIYYGKKSAKVVAMAQRFKQHYRLDSIRYHPLQHAYKEVLVVDSLGLYKSLGEQAAVVLRQSPKVHLEDLINKLQPKMVIADGSNYPSFVRRWKKTCAARGIPFHETAQQGAYPLN